MIKPKQAPQPTCPAEPVIGPLDFALHGAYCGPGWCGGQMGGTCDFNTPPVDDLDAACRQHDFLEGTAAQTSGDLMLALRAQIIAQAARSQTSTTYWYPVLADGALKWVLRPKPSHETGFIASMVSPTLYARGVYHMLQEGSVSDWLRYLAGTAYNYLSDQFYMSFGWSPSETADAYTLDYLPTQAVVTGSQTWAQYQPIYDPLDPDRGLDDSLIVKFTKLIGW